MTPALAPPPASSSPSSSASSSPAADPAQLLSVSVAPGRRPGHALVAVVGEVDAYTAPLLQLCLDSRAAQRGLRELVVDLEQVTYLGVAGVSVLTGASSRCREAGIRLVLRCADRRAVLRPLQLTGAAELIALDPAAPGRPLRRDGRTTARPHPTSRRPARGRRRRAHR